MNYELILNNAMGIMTVIIGIGFFVASKLDKGKRFMDQEKELLETKIRELYKEENMVQEDKIKNLTEQLELLQKKVTRIDNENKLLRDLVTERDQDSKLRHAKEEQFNRKIEKQSRENGKKISIVIQAQKIHTEHIEKLYGEIKKLVERQ